MRIYDISVPVRERMPLAPGNPSLKVDRAISPGSGSAGFRITMAAHAGTHLDLLSSETGAATLPLDALVGPAVVVDATAHEGDLEARSDLIEVDHADRLLFRTRNSTRDLWACDEFVQQSVQLSVELARELAARVRLVGIDYLNVGDEEVHRTLLEAGTVVLEGIDLRAVAAGRYWLVCLPLKLVGADGAPARAILIDDASLTGVGGG